MQAWNSVKVTNSESLHHGRAGKVVRVESKNDQRMVQTLLDQKGNPGDADFLPEEMEPFAEVELLLLM